MMNETLLALKQRASSKGFTGMLPEKEKLDAITLAAIQSPSALNLQPWKILVIANQELIKELDAETLEQMAHTPGYESFYQTVSSTGMDMTHNAPCMIVLAIDKNNQYAAYDCGIVTQSICIAAQSLDVASHIVAINSLAFEGEKGDYFKEKMHFPAGYAFGMAVLLGYGKSDDVPHEPQLDKIVFVD